MRKAVITLLAALSAIWPTSWGQESLPRDFPCTQEEYECLSLGRLLNPIDRRCYRVGELYGPCSSGQVFRANKTLAQRDGRLEGACLPPLCSSRNEVFAALTARCEDNSHFFGKICSETLKKYNVWGEALCAHSQDDKDSIRDNDPWNGRCSPPQQMIPALPPYYRNILTQATVPCTLQEHQCHVKQQVLFRDKCWPLRMRGPCAQGEWLVLDEKAVQILDSGYAAYNNESRIVPICVRRPCPPRQVLPVPGSVVGERCTLISLIRRRVCADLVLALDVFGRGGCTSHYILQSSELPQGINERQCFTPRTFTYSFVDSVAGTNCARGDDGNCVPDLNLLKSRVGSALLPEDD